MQNLRLDNRTSGSSKLEYVSMTAAVGDVAGEVRPAAGEDRWCGHLGHVVAIALGLSPVPWLEIIRVAHFLQQENIYQQTN
jgi:hypothetical protein